MDRRLLTPETQDCMMIFMKCIITYDEIVKFAHGRGKTLKFAEVAQIGEFCGYREKFTVRIYHDSI